MVNIAETYKYKNGREEFKIIIPITRPEKDVNVNGISFELGSYLKVMQSDYVKEMFNNGGMPLVIRAPKSVDSVEIIKIEDTIGTVVEWNTEYIVVKITPDNYNLYIAPYNDNDNGIPIKAGVIGAGEFVEGSKNVFSLQKVVAFQLLYGVSAKIYKRLEKEAVEEAADAETVEKQKEVLSFQVDETKE